MAEYRLSAAAKEDLIRIAQYGDENFGTTRSDLYRDRLRKRFVVLAAVEGSGLGNVFEKFVDGDSDRHIFLYLEFKPPTEAPLTVTLAPSVGHWTGVTVGDFLLRIKPDLTGDPGQQTVLLSTEISEITGERTYDLIATPSLTTKFDHEATIQIGEGDAALSLTLLPRWTL